MKAVGVGSFSGSSPAATAAASAAAIRFSFMPLLSHVVLFWLLWFCLYCRWVSKDGIGALGRLLIGRETMGKTNQCSWCYLRTSSVTRVFFQVDALVVFLTMILSNGACMLILLAVLEGLYYRTSALGGEPLTMYIASDCVSFCFAVSLIWPHNYTQPSSYF